MELDKFTKLVTFLAGIFLIITYAGLRLTYGQFYSTFGLSPEDVGWNRDLLLQSFAGPAFIAFYSDWFPYVFLFSLAAGASAITEMESEAYRRDESNCESS